MAIAIIVEDGSNVPNANSYVSLSGAREYAEYRGVELPSDDDELAALLIVGMDYLESKECEFQGYRANDTQSLSWPRSGVYLNCKEYPSDVIPSQLIGALVQLAIAQDAGIDIFPNTTSEDYITSAKVGPLSVSFSDPAKVGLGDLSPNMTAVDALLKPLFYQCNESAGLFTRRV